MYIQYDEVPRLRNDTSFHPHGMGLFPIYPFTATSYTLKGDCEGQGNFKNSVEYDTDHTAN